MESIILMILRQHMGVSPKTYQLWLMLLTVTASFLFYFIRTTFIA